MKQLVEEMQQYRIFRKLRPNMISKIYHYMEEVQFRRGQTVYTEGSTDLETVYFIKTGEFAVTKTPCENMLKDPDEDKKETSTHRKLHQSPVRCSKVKEMLISRSDRLFGTDKGGLAKNTSVKKFI